MAWSSQVNAMCARIRAVVASTTGLADKQVHDGIRDLDDPVAWEQLAWDNTTDREAGWMVDWIRSPSETQEGMSLNVSIRTHYFQLIGWSRVCDTQGGTAVSSAAAWRTLVEDVCHALRKDIFCAKPLDNDWCVGASPDGAPVVLVNEVRDIGGGGPTAGDLSGFAEAEDLAVSCHVATVELAVRERIVWS